MINNIIVGNKESTLTIDFISDNNPALVETFLERFCNKNNNIKILSYVLDYKDYIRSTLTLHILEENISLEDLI